MKLLLLSTEFPPGPGGIGTLAYQIAFYLAKDNWQITVATPQDHVRLPEIEQFNVRQPFRIVRLPHVGPMLMEGLYRLIKVTKLINRHRPDIILAIGKQALYLGGMINLITTIPLVVIGSGSEFIKRNPLDSALIRWTFGRARASVAISRYTSHLMASMGIDVSQTTVIYPGADDAVYKTGLSTEKLQTQLGLDRAKIILTVGHVSHRKAQDVVIKALPMLLEHHPNLHYVIAGLPTQRDQLEALAAALGVQDHVTFLGKVAQEELPYLYTLADVFVLVSRSTGDQVEGYGIVAVEAALCGTPAVVSSGCGLEEAVIEGETAFVVAPDDPTATADAVSKLLTDDGLHERMAVRAQHYAYNNATWSKRIKEYDILLRQLLSKIEKCVS
ncbi:MAG: glycosyltransferase family 4 protein [Anaerolineae bacterium]|nr:glycosyltransferase family 4 protein [Anaerolineae bacterium]